MGSNAKAQTMAVRIPNAPLTKSSSSTSFLAGASSSDWQEMANSAYVSNTPEVSNPKSPAPQSNTVVNVLTIYVPRLPNIANAIRPPSVSEEQSNQGKKE